MANGKGDPFGVSIYCTDGFPLRMRLCWGIENAQASAARRLSTNEGELDTIGDDPDYGYNVAAHVNASFNRGEMAAIGARVVAEVSKDPRYQNVRAKVFAGAGEGGGLNGLQIAVQGETAAGPFEFVLPVQDLTLAALNAGLAAAAK